MALVLRDPGGVPWSVLLRRPLSVVEAVWMGAATAAALAEVHSRGIVHTNLKPEHILVDLNRQAVSLIGFGLAVRPARTPPEGDPPQALAGTLAYMPPEQTGRMTSGVDTRSDLYALGVVLYQTLTGTLPFTASDPLELIHAHLARQAIPPVARNPAVPALLSDLVMRLLAKTPDERYQTAGGLAWDLRRCLEGFERPGPIDPFPLGEHDVPDRLRLPDRLHGRERQLEELQVAWQGVCDGRGPTLALVSGAPGTGKTRLVETLGREVRRSGGLFAAGKFTQYEPGVPHATMAEVLRALLRGVLATPEQEVARWRDGVAEAIGADGRVLMEMVPELAHLLGPQGPVPDLPARDAQNRFRAVSGQLLSALATADQPVAVFLDDLQWLDAETAGLLAPLLSHPGMQHLLLVGAYRSEEVAAEHPLAAVVRAIRATGAAVREIGLAPLDRGDLAALVADMLRISLDRAEPLAQLVHDKTDGNPFFAQQLLTSLHEEGLVVFLGGEGGWTWDLQGIRAKGFTDNVLELLSRKLGRLSAPAQDALKTLAMLGMRAPLELLSRALQAPPATVRQQLREAAQSGLIDCDDHECAFVHDRIREAAYALVPANERARRHLELGRLLLADRRIEDIDEDLFALANHFRQALVLVDDVTEREGVRRLIFRAGKTAKLAIAFDAARDYFADAIALLPGNRWTAPYEEVFALVGELTECEYLLGNLDRGNALFHELLAQARSDLDRAAVYRIRIVNFSAPPGTLPELLALILEALRFLGVDCPAGEQALDQAIRADEDLIATRLRNRPITDLANAPAIVDPRVAAAVDLLADTTALTRHSPRHAEWLTLQGLKLCLAHGHVPSSPMIYAFYAVHLSSVPGSIQRALAFSDLAVALDRRYGDLRWRPAVLSMYAGLVHSWGRPFRLARPFFDEAFSTAQLVWDRRFAPGLGMVAVWTEIEAATPIAKARAASKRYLDFTARVGSFFSNLCRQYVQFLACLEGHTTGLLSFDGPDFKEEEAVTLYRNSGYGSGVRQLWTLKLMAAVLLGQQDEASRYSVALRQIPTTLGSTIGAAEAFFQAMAAAMEYGKVAPDERAELAAAIDEVVSRLERWAADCPANFLSRYQLVLAEKARIEGRHLEALHLYDDAIASAREQGLLHMEGLACERAARFYLDQDLSRNAYAHLRDARAGYSQWGATAKVALLDREFPQIDKPADAGPSSTRGSPQAQIDLPYVVKAFQTLSGEIELDKLVQALLRLVLEQAGADRALLILSRSDGGYSIEAEAGMGPEGHRVQIGRAPLDSGQLPETVFRYVARTRESVLLDDAATSTLFVEDDYLLRQKPRSVLCLPLLKQAHLAGVLYLENHLAPGVFSPARVSTLEMIASQAAISLETARLYGDLATERSHLAAIIRQVPVGLAIAEAPSGRILVANQAA
ncbi:MAG: AAA family ATPase, partial [Myxococcales bacterium]